MKYSTGLGKYIEIDIDVFLSMDDEDFRDLRAGNYGLELPENPFYESYAKLRISPTDEITDQIINEILDESSLDIPEE